MPISITCSKCAKVLKAPDGSDGKVAQCPRCKTRIRIQRQAAPEAGPTEVAAADPGRCSACGKVLTRWNRAYGVREPQCAACYRKGADIGARVLKENPKSSGRTLLITAALLLAASPIAFVLAISSKEGSVSYGLNLATSLMTLVAGISFALAGRKKLKVERSRSESESETN
jgi:phage FluMu protein Com